MKKCPGQDMRNVKSEDIIEKECPFCGRMIELWPPEYREKCRGCQKVVSKDRAPNCADWCPGGEEGVKKCLGQERFEEWKAAKKAKENNP